MFTIGAGNSRWHWRNGASGNKAKKKHGVKPKRGKGKKSRRARKKEKKRDWHKKVIERAAGYASENISNLETLLTIVMRKGFISEEEYETVTSKATSREKRRCMVLLFAYKSEQAFEALEEALIETSSPHVVEEFRRVENEIDVEERQLRKALERKGRKSKTYRRRKHLKDDSDETSSSSSDSEDTESESESEEEYDEIKELVDLFYEVREGVRRMNYYPDKEFFVNRFQIPNTNVEQQNGINLVELQANNIANLVKKPVNTELRYSLPFWIKTQHFRVNRSIFLSKVGFLGPPEKTAITSYGIKVQLIKREPREAKCLQLAVNDNIGIVAASFQAVDVKHGEILYIPFKYPVGIEPNTWYKIKFKITGLDEILVVSKENKLPEATVNCDRHGDVKFEFGTKFFNSTFQMPILGFFKGKGRLTVSSFPSTFLELVAFNNQQDVIDWEDTEELRAKAVDLLRADN